MIYRNHNKNSTARSFSAVLLTGAMGPGYPVRTVRSAIDRRLGEAPWSVEPDDCDHYDLAPGSRIDQWSKRQIVRRVLGWVRHHPGYAGAPSQDALDTISHVARNPRR